MAESRRLKYFFVQSLTLGRAPLIFIFLAVSLFGPQTLSSFWFSIAFGAMILSAVSDLFDGYFARKFEVVSRLGAYADPLTDKIFYLTAFPTLVFLAARDGMVGDGLGHAKLLLGLAILFLLRDQWVSFLRSIGALYNMDAKANWSGKARTAISFPAICVIYYYLQAPANWILQREESKEYVAYLVYGLEVASMTINVISIGVYTSYYWPCLKKEMRLPEKKKKKDNQD